jgi:serine O-acetyltransferase
MNMDEKFLKCLSCGKNLEETKKTGINYCTDCVLDLEYTTEQLDHQKIDKYLQQILDFFVSDVKAAFNKDPAAHSLIEVLTSYPGLKAILIYRIAHLLWELNMPFIPRYLSEVGRELTGVEIHPGAEIGSDFFIDHGSGVVIGETSEIGNNVTMYQGVVLGGVSTDPVKRHPTVGNNVVIGTGAKLLGAIKIGDNVKIGANSVVVNDVPDNSVVVGVPGRIISREGEKVQRIDLRHGDLPDPLSITLSNLDDRLRQLEKKLDLETETQKKIKDSPYEIYYGKYGGGI